MSLQYKVIFAHDHRFIFDDGKYYSRGGLPEEVLQRYSSFFGAVDVICRIEKTTAHGLAPIHREDIQFCPQTDIRKLSNIRFLNVVERDVAKLVQEADGVIARLPSSLGWLAARAARLQGKPYLIEVVGNAKEASRLHGSKLGAIFGKIEHLLTKYEVRQAKHVIYITERHLQTIYPTNGSEYVCPNVSIQGGLSNDILSRQAHFPRQHEQKIGLIGSLDVKYKGHDIAINTIARLIRDHGLSSVSLHLAGGGDQERWKKLAASYDIEKQVKFHGSIPAGAEMMSWIDDMDIMLQPSLTEGQGRGIIEAMSRAKPVVASNVGGIPELLSQEWMVNPNDAVAFAERCAKILLDQSMYQATSTYNFCRSQDFNGEQIDKVRRRAFDSIRMQAENSHSFQTNKILS